MKKIIAILSIALIAGCGVPSKPSDPSLSLVKQTITKTNITNRKIETVNIEGGTGVLIDDLGAYWVKDGVAYAVNGMAKSWSPSIEYARNSKVSHNSIQDAIRQK